VTTTGKGRSLTRDEIADALDWLDPSCGREDWIRIGASVKAAGEDLGEDLFEVWRAWSERGDGYNAKTIASDWRALLRGRSEKSISAGTLVYLAKAKGWIDPRKEKVDLAGAATNPRRKPPAEMVETDPDAIAAARQKVAKTLERDGFRIVAEYRYADDFFVLRLENGKGAKTLRPLSFDGYEWSPKAPDGLRPLYNLEEIVAADPKEMVFVVEGEKCADYAKSIGLVATTSSNGYQSAGRTDWSPLRGRSVCILPDRDAAGETYAMAVEKTLRGLDCEIRVARLASNRQRETPVGFDLADWIDEAEETESQTLAAAVRDLATKSTIVVRREGASLLDDLEGFEKSLAETHGVEFIGLPCGCFPRLDAMLDGWQGLGVLAAEPGLGKTTLLLQAGLGIVTANEDAAFVFLSLEMGRGAMLRRLVCQATRIPYRTLRKGDPNEGEGEGGLRLSDRDRDRLRVGLKNLRDLAPRIAIVDSEDMGRGLGVEEFGDRLVQRVEAFKARAGCGRAFVLVDHLGRLPSGSQSNLSSLERDDARISTLLAAQRRLGSDPVVVVSQVRKSDYERPGLASAKGSAEVSYSPDFMLAAWKTDADDGGAAAYGVGMPTETRFEVEIVKGRDGMIRGRVPMRFIVDEHRIEEETR
jgi:hypothetical protein